jgi:hypothetical protein
LHRLYRVQKQLMSGGLSGRGPSCRCQRRRQQRRALGLHLPAEGHPTPQSREDELELTLAVGGRRKRRGEEGTAPAVAFRPRKRDGGEAAAPAGEEGTASAVAFRPRKRDGGEAAAPCMARVQCLTQPQDGMEMVVDQTIKA